MTGDKYSTLVNNQITSTPQRTDRFPQKLWFQDDRGHLHYERWVRDK